MVWHDPGVMGSNPSRQTLVGSNTSRVKPQNGGRTPNEVEPQMGSNCGRIPGGRFEPWSDQT